MHDDKNEKNTYYLDGFGIEMRIVIKYFFQISFTVPLTLSKDKKKWEEDAWGKIAVIVLSNRIVFTEIYFSVGGFLELNRLFFIKFEKKIVRIVLHKGE